MGIKFEVIPDNIDCQSTIYNSKITSVASSELNVASIRIDIIDESLNEIQNILTPIIVFADKFKIKKKTTIKIDINSNFVDDSVLVVLTKEYSEIEVDYKDTIFWFFHFRRFIIIRS